LFGCPLSFPEIANTLEVGASVVHQLHRPLSLGLFDNSLPMKIMP
jgi:hypothetical protein